MIERKGGLVFFGVSDKIDYVVSTPEEARKARFTQAKNLGLLIVTEAFVLDSLRKDVLQETAPYLVHDSDADEESSTRRLQIKHGVVVEE